MMSFFPCALCPWNKPKTGVTYVRILHASPDLPAVNVYAGSILLAENLHYRSCSDYRPLMPGEYLIGVVPVRADTVQVLSQRVPVFENEVLTLALADSGPNLTLNRFPESIPTRQAFIRLIHLASDAPLLDLTLPDGTVLAQNTGYGKSSSYLPIDDNVAILQLRFAGTKTIVHTLPEVQLKKDHYYSVYAIGFFGQDPPLQGLLIQDYGKG